MRGLTNKQIKRQDFVDNQIFELLLRVRSQSKELKWDIEIIGDVRDIIQKYFFDKKIITNETEFYP